MKTKPPNGPADSDAEAGFRDLLDAANDLIFILSPDARFLYSNRAFQTALGYSAEELRALNIFDLLHPSCLEICQQHFQALTQRAHPQTFETEFVTRNGRTIIAEGNCNRENQNGKPGVIRGIFRDVTERKRAEEAVLKSEEMYRTLVERAPDAIFISDAGLRFIDLNDRACELSGYTRGEILQMSIPDFMSPEDIVSAPLRIDELRQGKTVMMERRFIRKDGSLVPVEVSSKFLSDGRLQAIVRDITERKQSEAALRESEQLSRSVLENIDEIIYIVSAGSEDPVRGTVQFVSGRVEQIIGYKPDEFVNDPELWFSLLHPDDVPAVVDSTRKIFQEKQSLTRVYRVRHKHTGQYCWMEDHVVPRLDDAGAVAATFGVARDITARKRAEDALRVSEDRYRDLFEHSQDLICIHDLQGQILSANPAIARLVGSSASDSIMKMNLRDLLAPEVRDQFEAYIAAIRRDGSASGLARIQTVSGEQRILEYNNTLRTEGVADPVVRGIAHDITERRRAEESLYENERRFRQIAENLEDVLWMTDREARNVLYINPAYEAVWGRSCESLYKRQLSFVEAVHADDRENVQRILKMQAGGCHEPFEYRIVKPDGSIRWIRDRSFPIRNNEGEIYRIAGLAEDITERKRAEEALLASELKYRNIFTFAPVGIYQSSRNGTLITVNKALADMLAYDSVDEFLKVNFADVYFTEDEREKLIREHEDRGYAGDLELRWKRQDGSPIWVQLTAHAIKSTDGLTEYFEGFVRDITERKLAEAALRESEERYRDLVETSSELICTHDLEGWILSANRAAAEALGVGFSDYISKRNLRDILAPEVRDGFDDYLARISKDGFADGIMLVQTSTGERRLWEYHNTLRTEGVAAPIVRGMARDITERKRAEAALRESETKFRVLAETAASAILMYQDDMLIYANPATAAITGYPVEELVGMSLWDLVHPDFKVVIMQRRRARERGEPIPPRYETKIIAKGGKERWADYTIGAIQFESKPTIIVTAFDTTERKRAEAALRESEERYRTLFETAPDAVGVFDTQLKLIMANRRAVEMFGYNNSAEMIGLSAFDIIAPQLRARVRSNAKRVLEMGGMPPVESIGVKKDGTQFAVESSATLIGDAQGKPMAILGVTRDITERKLIEDALRESEERFRTQYENIPLPTYTWQSVGDDFVLLAYNRAAEEYTHGRVAELIGKSATELYADSPEVTNYLRRCYLERTAFSEEMLYRFRTLDEERYLQASFAYVPPDLVLVHADDITERKRAQEELRTYSGRLIEAQEAERLRIARELHDQVGQILTVVQINLHAVQRACRTAEDSARVEDSIRVLDEALDQVHNLALDLRPSLLDDLGLAAALRWFVGRQARRTGVQPRVLIELPDNMRFALELETACFRIAQEALTNVVRHAQAKRVSVELQKDETDLLLTIKDDGVGFDVKVQSHRAPNAATLGLLGMQERAHTVGGTIVIDSAPTKGTKIRCRFPIKARSQTDGFESKR
jgi:PAS domain S-box-containing protein